MTTRATLTSKGQITIPQEVRQRLGLKQGDQVEFVTEKGMTHVLHLFRGLKKDVLVRSLRCDDPNRPALA